MKISIIMQSYLGDYPYSRKNPELKFIRAVYSIINQIYENWELVIISDGCNITNKLYSTYFKNYDNIKLVKISKPEDTETYSNGNYRRAYPKQVGLDNATGDFICYLDSDDMFTKKALYDLEKVISKTYETCKKNNLTFPRYFLNNSAIYNKIKLDNIDYNSLKDEDITYEQRGDLYKIRGLPNIWTTLKLVLHNSETEPYPFETHSIIHRRGHPSHEWKDINDMSLTDSMSFISSILNEKEIKYVLNISVPYYIKCFEKNTWDC